MDCILVVHVSKVYLVVRVVFLLLMLYSDDI